MGRSGYITAGLFLLSLILLIRLVNLKRSIVDLKEIKIQKKNYFVDFTIRKNETTSFDPALTSLFYQKPVNTKTEKPAPIQSSFLNRATVFRYIGFVETGGSRIYSFRDNITGKLVLYKEESVPNELKDQIITAVNR